MLFSVIVPVYNVERYLDKCMESLLAQVYTDYEIILVDDGSTDTSGSLCDKYAEQYDNISVIHQANKGLGGARNAGIDAAKGEYLFFVDSDDYVDNDILKILAECIERNPCDMVFFDPQAVYENGQRGPLYPCSIPNNITLETSSTKSLVFYSGAWNRVYRRTLFEKSGIRFPERLWYEDLRTVSKLFLFTDTVYYYNDKPLYFYLQRAGSIMHTPDFNRIVEERISAVSNVLEYYKEKKLFDVYRDELEFLWLFHGFFLPVREMQAMSKTFPSYADELREQLLLNFPDAFKNKYIDMQLNNKEKFLLNCAAKRRYLTIKLFSFANKLIKRIKNVK